MPAFLLIGIPIIVAVLLLGILNLPDEEKPVIDEVIKKTKSKKKKST